MNRKSDNCVMLFVKYPHHGMVKTRIAELLGPELTTAIYRHFVTDTLATLQNIEADLRIFFHSPEDSEGFISWLGPEYSYVPQTGGDLGRRMKNAFEYVFAEGFSKAVLIGSDSPDLPGGFIRSALLTLDSCGAVIGPAADGGYYLLGFSKTLFLAKVFENIPWSSSDVCPRTLDILRNHSQKVSLLPQWCDVDTPADLRLLVLRNQYTDFRRSETFRFLLKNEIIQPASVLIWSCDNV